MIKRAGGVTIALNKAPRDRWQRRRGYPVPRRQKSRGDSGGGGGAIVAAAEGDTGASTGRMAAEASTELAP